MGFLEFMGLSVGVIYFGAAMYAESQRHKSSFWCGWSDVTGFRIFGFNLDKGVVKENNLPFNNPIVISLSSLEREIDNIKEVRNESKEN